MDDQKTVLAIDDNPQQLQTYKIFLQGKYKLQLAVSVEASREYLTASLPDVILLDIEMPNIDGFQFLKKIRQHFNKMGEEVRPIIVVTGNDDDHFKSEIRKHDVFDILYKPVNKFILIQIIERALAV